MALSLDQIRTARENKISDDVMVDTIARKHPDYAEKIQLARQQNISSQAIMSAIEKRLSTQTANNEQQQSVNPEQKDGNVNPLYITKKQKSLMDHFVSGLAEKSTSGQLAKFADGNNSEQPNTEDPKFWGSLAESAGEIVGDLPFMAAGATIGTIVGGAAGGTVGPVGTAVGGVAGGLFGTMAMPAFLKASLTEYRDYVNKGNDLTFGEFLQRADQVASKTLTEGAFGIILGAVNKVMPLLKENKTVGNLFNNKYVQKSGSVALETTAVATIPKLSQGELPTSEDWAHAAAIVAGFNLLKAPKAIRERYIKEGEASGKSPEEFAKSGVAQDIFNEIHAEPKEKLSKKIEELPKNKKAVAEKAVSKGLIDNPEDLNRMLTKYDQTYQNLPGKKLNDKTRAFLKNFAGIRTLPVEQIKGESDVPRPKMSEVEKLRRYGRDLQVAKSNGDQAAIKEAQRKVDLQKKRMKNQEKSTVVEKPIDKPTEKSIEKELVKPESSTESTTEKTNVKPEESSKKEAQLQAQIDKVNKQPDSTIKTAKLRALNKNLAFVKKKTKKPKVVQPIIETTGEGAEQRLDFKKPRSVRLIETAKSAKETLSDPKGLAHKLNTKIFNFLAPLEKLETDLTTSEKVSTKIKQAQSAASEVNSVLENGIYDNVTDTFVTGSLKDVYVGRGKRWSTLRRGKADSEYNIQDFDVYRTSRQALKRQSEGKKTGIDTAVAQKDVARLKQKYEPIVQDMFKFQKETSEHYGKNMLGDKGLEQWNKDAHSSLYRVMDYGKDSMVKQGSLNPTKWWKPFEGSTRQIIPPSESDAKNLSMMISNSRKNDSILQYKKQVEAGNLPGKVVKSKGRKAPKEMATELKLDPDSQEMADLLYDQSRKDAFFTEGGKLRGWDNGKVFEIEVPKEVYDTFSSLAPSDTGFFTNIFKKTNQLFSKAIVLEPIKAVSIFGRDALSSLIYSKTGSNPLSIFKAMKGIIGNSESWKKFQAQGGDTYATRLMLRGERQAKISQLAEEHGNITLVPFKKMAEFFKKSHQAMTASVPFAEYERALQKFGDTEIGRTQALVESKSVTYNPNNKGSSKLAKIAANVMPFFNVMLQEPAMIAKNLKRPLFVAKGLAYITMPSLLLKMYNEGNPDYDDMNPILKASCWHFYTPLGHFAIPIPWLLGATFKALPEAMYDYLKNNDKDGLKGLNSYVASQLSGTFPPIAVAGYELASGKKLNTPAATAASMFLPIEGRTSPTVVPRRLENLPPEQQYTSKTNQLSRQWGQLWGVSPIKTENFIKTFLPGIGQDALAIMDEILYATGMSEDLRPEQREKNFLAMGKFLYEQTPSNTKYTEKFYNMLEKSGMDDKRGLPNNHKQLQKESKKISSLFKKFRDVETQKMNPRDKKIELQEIQKQINDAFKNAVLSNETNGD